MLQGALEEVVIVKRNMKENIEQGKMKSSQNDLKHSFLQRANLLRNFTNILHLIGGI